MTAQTRSFVFNGDNKQTQVKDANGVPIGTYFYDGEGKRVKKVTNTETTVFVYSSGKLVAEYSTAAPPSNPAVSYTTTDHLGSPRVITDALGQVTSRRDFLPFGEDIFANIGGRTTALKYGSTQVGSTNETIYHDESGGSWVKAKNQIDDTHYAENTAYVDGLGRTFKTEELNSAGNIFTEKEFDAEGRVYRVSNPYRSGDAKIWTTNTYDTASRIWKVTTSDNAVVETVYGVAVTGSETGTYVTVTDQAGKVRRSITNVLGQLIRVDEPNSSNALGTVSSPNQATYYSYDTLNNLTTVTQGSQTRTFSYDSLSRLTQAVNPESGTIKYTYDDNSNLKTKWDARGIKTIYDYDAVNRVWDRCYKSVGTSSLGYTSCAAASGETAEANTPDVAYTYDNKTNATGKLTKVASSVSTTEYTSFDILGRVTAAKQTTDGTDYTTGYTFYLNGALDEETYPSGRVVKNVLDNNGDLSQVESARCGSTHGVSASCIDQQGFFNYAKNFTYNAAGAVTSMQLGNGRWESTTFNSRLQPTQIALGVTSNATDLLKLNYTYGTTDNNGNVLTQDISVKRSGSSDLVFNQTYTYDELNRLTIAEEKTGSTTNWKQTFTYDRYGNRNFNESQTTMPSSFSNPAVSDPTISTSTNRITSSGWTYDSSGNTTADAGGQTYIYDAENKMISASNSSGTLGEYAYDGDGKRVKKVVPDTGETTVFVYDAAGKQIAEYSTIVANSTDAKVNYLTNDHLGSPRINTDANGSVITRHDYHPFGEEIDGVGGRTTGLNYGSDTVRKQFTGYERDSEVDLDYAQARYYANALGRFTTVDPTMASAEIVNPQTFNRYIYVGNNPINITDPTGEIWGQKGGAVQWFDTEDAMKTAGFSAYTPLVARIPGTDQLVVLNATANASTPVVGAEQALRLIVASGAAAAVVEASAAALGYVAVTAGTSYLIYKAAEYNAQHPEQVRVWGCPAIADCPVNGERQAFGDHFPWILKMSSTEEGESSSSEEAAEDSINTENNKPDTSANKGGSENKDARKINQKRKDSSEQREQNYRNELRELERQPRTNESRQRIVYLKKQIKHEQLKQRKSESHGRKAKGT